MDKELSSATADAPRSGSVSPAPSATESTSSKAKKRNSLTTTPASLQTSLQQIHASLATTFPQNAPLPAFTQLIHTYLTSSTKAIQANIQQSTNASSTDSSSSNLPQIIANNMTNQIRTIASKILSETPPHVHLNTKDSAPQLHIDPDTKLTVRGGMRGYRMVRANQGVDSGNWYYEVEILEPPSVQEIVDSLPSNVRLGDGVREGLKKGLEEELARAKENEDGSSMDGMNDPARKKRKVNPPGVEQYSVGGHVRIGWSMRTGELQAPVGYDRWSYGIRDISGSRIHNSKREDKWGGVGFAPGDVIGFAVCLVEKDDGLDGSSHNDDSDNVSKKNQSVVQSNHIRFFKNGQPMGHFVVSRGTKTGGEAFDGIQSGTYYPAVSSYMGGTVRCNFGPYFIYPPKGLPTGLKLNPICEMAPKPLEPGEVLDLFKKEKCILKKVDEDVTNAIHDSVFLEAKLRFDKFQEHLKEHVHVVRKGREDRSMATSDLPEEELENEPEVMDIDLAKPAETQENVEMETESKPVEA